MKGFSLPILILGLIFIAIGAYFLSNNFCGASGPGFAVNDGKLTTSSSDTYSFSKGKSTLKMTDGTNKSFKHIASYLQKNEFKTLALTGTQFAGETGTNLGVARAEAVKNKLVKSYKAPGDRISVDGQTLNNKVTTKSVLGGVEFVFNGDAGEGAAAGSEKKTNVGAGAVDLGIGGLNYAFLFPDSKVNLTKTSEMSDYLAKLKAFFKENKTAKLAIVGHTDNAESESKNVRRADSMAKKVRRFFRDNGISGSNIVTDAKGSSEPEVAQDSAEAGNLNNRVVLYIQE